MLDADVCETKQRIAEENMELLQRKSINLAGKRVLDVGFGLGYNASAMKELGAIVYGVEPDKEAFEYAVSNGLIDKTKVFNCSLQNIPKDLLGFFDVVTVFLYCVYYSEREEFANMLAKVVKPDGTVVVGIYDKIFITGDKVIEPVSSSIHRFFDSVCFVKTDHYVNRFLILAKSPFLEAKKSEIVRDYISLTNETFCEGKIYPRKRVMAMRKGKFS